MLRVWTVRAFFLWSCLVQVGLPAPSRATDADAVCEPDDANPCRVSTRINITPGSVIDVGERELFIDAGGALSIGTGQMDIRAGTLRVANNGSLLGQGTAEDDGGTINVDADTIIIAGRIDVTGSSGGSVVLRSSGSLAVTGLIEASRISNQGGGGTIDLIGATVNVSGTLNSRGGAFNFGGDVSFEATGDVMFSGRIDVQGEDGGSVGFLAGTGLTGAGNITISDTALVDADSITAGGFGGDIDFDARGDGTATGNIVLGGNFSSVGGTGTDETTGGDGGSVCATSIGDIVAAARGTQINVEGGRPDGFGGDIALDAGAAFSYAGDLNFGPLGLSGGAGDLDISAGTEAILSGSIVGSGGLATIDSAGDINITQSAGIDLGDLGSLCLDAGDTASTQPARVVVSGSLTVNAGSIDIVAKDAVTISGPVRSDGAQAGGDGGSVSVQVQQGPLLVNAVVSAKGRNPGNRDGGSIGLEGRRIRIASRLDVDGTGGNAGIVEVTGDEIIEVLATATLTASTITMGNGGGVTLVSQGDLAIAGSLVSNGGPAAVAGGTNMVQGCAVRIEEQALLQALRPNGTNRIVGRESVFVLGRMTADTNGMNEIRYRNADDEPIVFGDIEPRETLVLDPSLMGCVANECGNGAEEPPETCDDGNQVSGDGCSSTCRIEVAGDVDGDEAVTAADADALVTELFDGDPTDQVSDVDSEQGEFAGTVGADANDDGRVTVADLPAILEILGD